MTVIADRYELGPAIGAGGMARVLRAHDQVLQRDVAVKMLREDLDQSGVMAERFVREARLAGSLSHPAIVQVYDAGVHEGHPWMAMELVPGATLSDRLKELGRFEVDEAIQIMAPILDGLHAAHTAGVIHRDIKPANIILSPSGAKLADFGIAKSLMTTDLDLTAVDQFMGTPKYIAPEVALGEQAGGQADLYSAAVVLWEMLAGRAPFTHEHPITLAMMHHTDPLPRIEELRPDLPRPLVLTLEAALAKAPDSRQASADVMRRQLLGELPPPAPSPGRAGGTAGATPTGPVNDAATAPTQALPRERPARAAPAPVGPDDADRPGWPLAIAVGVLTLLAVIGFTLFNDSGSPDTAEPAPTTAAPTQSAVPTASPTAPAPVAPAPTPAPAPPVATTDPAEPSPTPTPQAPTEPTEAEIPEPPEPEPPAEPEPTEDPDGGGSAPIPVPVPSLGGDASSTQAAGEPAQADTSEPDSGTDFG